jgi:hypothetical protein
MMVDLTPKEEQAAREKAAKRLAGIKANDNQLAVEGFRYLRDPDRPQRRRSKLTDGRS